MTRISVLVKPNSKKEGVERLDDGSYVVRVNVPPIEGKANQRVSELLSKFFKKPKTGIQLVSGKKSKTKIFEV